METQLLELFNAFPYGISLLAGIITFLSPCVLPLVPAYLSYISGVTVNQMRSDEMLIGMRFKILQNAIAFVLGFSLIFIVFGAIMADLMGNIFDLKYSMWVSGGIVILFGVHFIGIIKIKWLYAQKQLSFLAPLLDQTNTSSGTPSGRLAALKRLFPPFLLGLSFALGWTPCIGPIYASIIALGAMDTAKALSLMVTYTIGLGIPFLLVGFFIGRAMLFMDRFKKHLRKVEILSGILLIIIGIMIIRGDMATLSYLLINKLPLL